MPPRKAGDLLSNGCEKIADHEVALGPDDAQAATNRGGTSRKPRMSLPFTPSVHPGNPG